MAKSASSMDAETISDEQTSIFISSVQKELAEERRAVRDFVRGDALLRRFFDVFLFEDLPASDRRADDVYLDEVGRCPIYVGLFGQEYGYEDATGLSPTEREFNQATDPAQTAFHLCERRGRPWPSPEDARPYQQSRRAIDPPPFQRDRRSYRLTIRQSR